MPWRRECCAHRKRAFLCLAFADRKNEYKIGLRSRSRNLKEFLGGVGVGFLTTLGVGVVLFLSDSDSGYPIGLFFTSQEFPIPKFGIPVEMVQFLLKLLLKQISCCAPRFPLILTAKFHSLYAMESESGVGPESGILERSELGVAAGNFGKFGG